MGATWFGPQHRNLIGLLNELSLGSFKQYMQGPIIYEADPSSPPQLMNVPQGEPSFRIMGGTKAIIDTLAKDLSVEEVVLNAPVHSVDFSEKVIKIKTTDQSFEADKVISTLPPALLVSSIQFNPALPEKLVDVATQTHTWMQDSIKAGISYERPFWKEKEWSGTLFSNVGPLTEFYDHSDSTDSKFALCGFVHEVFAQLTADERLDRVNKQLKSAFGTESLDYVKYEEILWSKEVYTKHQSGTEVIPHQNNGHAVYQNPLFDRRLYIGGSETSLQYGGYMDGAVHAAESTVQKVSNDLD